MTQPITLTRPQGDGALRVLQALDGAGHVSQRKLAESVGLAASQVNRIIRSLVTRGHLRVMDDSVRPYAYHLTAAGEAHLRRLSYEAYAVALDQVRRVRSRIRARLAGLGEEGVRRVVFYGAGELAEVALALARPLGLEVAGVVDDDPAKQGTRRGTLTVTAPDSVAALAPDALVITSFRHADRIREQIGNGSAPLVRVVEL